LSFKHTDTTELIIRAFYTVYNMLGYGFLERVYGNALAIELGKLGVEAIQEAPIVVYYDNRVIGEYFVDLLVADTVIVELKAVRRLLEEHEAQLLNYLKATSYEVGLLLNFGPKPQIKRKAFDNVRKGSMRWLEAAPGWQEVIGICADCVDLHPESWHDCGEKYRVAQ
jgi:GxxExxY protein